MKAVGAKKGPNGKSSTTSTKVGPLNKQRIVENKAEGKVSQAKKSSVASRPVSKQQVAKGSTAAAVVPKKSGKANAAAAGAKDSTTVSQVLANHRTREIGTPRGSMFNDISSIIDCINENDGIRVDDQRRSEFRFRPVTLDDCHQAITLSVGILFDIADKVVKEDAKKEVLARARAIKLAVQQSWLSSQSFQFFNDKRVFESMTEQMRMDVIDAEHEPQPCPPDVFMSNQAKIKVRMKPVLIPQKESKWSVPRSLLLKRGGTLRNQVSPPKLGASMRKGGSSDTSMCGGEPKDTGRRGRAKHFRSHKQLSVADFNTAQDARKSFIDDGSHSHNKSFSGREGSRNKRSIFDRRARSNRSPVPIPEPVKLRDLSDYVSTGSGKMSVSDEEWSEVALKRKKTIRAKNLLDDRENQMLKLRTKPAAKDKRNMVGTSNFKDTGMSQTQPKTEDQVQASLLAHEARLAKQQVKFSHDGPAIVEQEAPGFPISHNQNKKHKRIVLKKKVTAYMNQQSTESSQVLQESNTSIDQVGRTVQATFAPEYGAMGSKMAKTVQQVLDSKNLNYSTQKFVKDASKAKIHPLNDSNDKLDNLMNKKQPNILPQLMKDTLLKKLEQIDKMSNRTKLMPSALFSKTQRSEQIPTMIGQMCPYQIKQLGTKPHYKIDAGTFHVSPREPNRKHMISSESEFALNNSASQIRTAQRGLKSHSTTDLFDHLLAEQSGKAGPSKLESRLSLHTKLSAKGSMKNLFNTADDSKVLPPVSRDRIFQSIQNYQEKKKTNRKVTVKESDLDLDTIDPSDEKTIDDHKNYLSIIQQRNDDSENVSPPTKLKSNKNANKVIILPQLETKHLSKGHHAKHQSISYNDRDRVIVKKSSSVPQLLAVETPQNKANPQLIGADALVQSCYSSFGNTPKNGLVKSGSVNVLGRTNTQVGLKQMPLNQTTNFSSMQGVSGVGGSQVFSIGRNIAKFENQFSMQTIRPSKASKISMLKANTGASISGFTDKVQIKNLELSKKLAEDRGLEKPASKTTRLHNLMTIGDKSAQGVQGSMKGILEKKDDGKQMPSRQQQSQLF